MKQIRNILCYSHYEFDRIMDSYGWIDCPAKGNCAISICSPNEDDLAEHWFDKDCHSKGINGISHENVFNLDIDDVHPFWFMDKENECYDKSLELYKDFKIKESNAYFSQLYICGNDHEFCNMLHALDYEEAFDLVKFIDKQIKKCETFYIHCAAGASRSQGVVRYIVDTYGNEYDIKLNPNNPNNTYNPHVCMMLKRAYRELFMKSLDESYFETEPMKFNKDIKLNLL